MPDSPPQPIAPSGPQERAVDPVPSDARTLRLEQLGEALAEPSRPTLLLPEASAAGETKRDPRDFEGQPFGRYRLLVELGRGGMGVVHKAWDTQLRRVVALKQVLAEGGLTRAQVDRFLREARLAARLRHPHIVGVLDVAEHEGRPYLTSEFVEARSLEVLMRTPVEPTRALRWTKAVAEALQYAHDAGIVHRDVKPSNILIDTEGHPFLTDFGLAKEVENAGHGETTLTLSGSLVGTPQYMSPEQASGRSESIGPAADQFSLGVVLYEMLTGVLPFQGDGLRELLNAITEHEPIPPRRVRPGIDRDTETICLKALEKDPARRYARIGDMAEDVGRVLAGQPIQARPRSLAERAGRALSRHRRVVAAVSLTAAILVAVGVPALRDRARRAAEARAERDALQRAAAEKEAALREAQAILEKAGRVQSVLARWTLLAPEVRALETLAYDRRLSTRELERRSEPHWKRVERFLEETPSDSASRSVALALAGWAKRFTGNDEESLDWMRRAARLDPDLPHGALMEALRWFSDYVLYQPLPMFAVAQDSLTFERVPPESVEMRHAREEFERLIQAAASARVWGEGLDRDFRAAVDAFRAIQAERYEEAEEGLTLAIGSPAMQACEADLLLARAKVRYFLRRFRDGLEDVARVLERRGQNCGAWAYQGLLLIGAAIIDLRDGRDPVPAYDQAAESFQAALDRGGSREWNLAGRAIALARKGEVEGRRGLDARPTFDAALRDLGVLLDAAPSDTGWLANRSGVLVRRGQAEEIAGGDPIPWLERAVRDAEAAERGDPDRPDVLAALATALEARALARRRVGEDARPELRKAIERLDRAVRRSPDNPDLWAARGDTHRRVAEEDLARGEDPTDAFRNSLRDLDEAVRLAPDDVSALLARAKTRRSLGEAASRSGDDPFPHFERSLADLDRAILARPSNSEAWTERGLTRTSLGYARSLRKEDARDILKDAIDDFTKAIERNPESVIARNNRGIALTKYGEAQARQRCDPRPSFTSAIEEYDTILARNPSYATAWQNRALVRIALADVARTVGEDPQPIWEAALEDLSRFQALDPTSWRGPATRGLIYERMGRMDDAVREYEEALNLSPGQPSVKAQLDALRSK